jgi:hypothetical protein
MCVFSYFLLSQFHLRDVSLLLYSCVGSGHLSRRAGSATSLHKLEEYIFNDVLRLSLGWSGTDASHLQFTEEKDFLFFFFTQISSVLHIDHAPNFVIKQK